MRHDVRPTAVPVSRFYRLPVDAIHTLHVRHVVPELAAPTLPVIVVHGGPGGGKSSKYLTALKPPPTARRTTRSRQSTTRPRQSTARRQQTADVTSELDVVLYDQRGCGSSTPLNELRRNTTAALVRDIERVRRFVRRQTGDSKWDRVCVYGASFGATLAVLYAAAYPQRVRCVVAHGFTRLRGDLFSRRLRARHPDIWRRWLAAVPAPRTAAARRFYTAYGDALQRGSLRAVRAWGALESERTLYYSGRREREEGESATHRHRRSGVRTLALIECHFARHGSFLRRSGVDLAAVAERIGDVPVYLTHGAADCICDVEDAAALRDALANAALHVVARAGHALAERGTRCALQRIFRLEVRRYASNHMLVRENELSN
jgi:proline iminopeptidase